MEDSGGLLLAGVICMAVAGVDLGIALFLYLRTRDFLKVAVDAQGTVVGHTTSSGSEGGTVYHSVVSFQAADGQTVEFQDRMGSSPPSHDVGEAVAVKYDPSRPEKARLSGTFRLYLVPGILALIGLPTLVVGAVLLVVAAA